MRPTTNTDAYSNANSDTVTNAVTVTNSVANPNTDSQPLADVYGHAYSNTDTLRGAYHNSDKRKHCAGHHRHW